MKRAPCVAICCAWMVCWGIPLLGHGQELGTKEWTSPQEAKEANPETESLEPVVVTATRLEEPVSQATKSIGVVTAADRNEQQQYFLPQLLDDEPGVFTIRNGGPGQFSSISIRGAGTQHTQFQYNGFPLRDAADTQSTLQYLLQDLYSGSNLKQVEILKGTQSTLYGSQAMGGVVNIIPQKWKRGFGCEFRSEVGDHNTFLENGRVYYGQDRFYLDINPLFVHTDGDRNGGRHDYFYDNLGFLGGAGVKFGPGMALEFSSLYYDSDLAMSEVVPGLDSRGRLIKNLADPHAHREGLLQQYGLSFTHEVNPCWDYRLKGAYTGTERHYFWSDNRGDQSDYDGSTNYLEMQHNIHTTPWLTLVVGANYEHAYYDGREPLDPFFGDYTPVSFEEDWDVWDIFGGANVKLFDESLLISGGGRYNHHQVFDPKFVGEASAAYLFKPWGTKIHAAFGTGYRTPSLYETYGGYLFLGRLVTIGNQDLKPEESTSFEAGIDQSFFNDKITLGFTWFHTDFEDLIIFDGFENKYMNASQAKSEGFETYVGFKPFSCLRFHTAYTYVDAQYEDFRGERWVRREYLPKHKVSTTATIVPLEPLTVALRLNWLDTKIVPLYDPFFNRVRWKEPSRWTVDASLTYRFYKECELWVRAENLFDTHYSESGYTMPGQWFYGGVKFRF
ncbi:MAG: TonB-dependent receptor [Deltaproteobacteria bacterium]|nr:TonB-dependent receptor [Deltaproteobacteria bacterium]